MSDAVDKDEQTEEPTEKRLKDALERGEAPVSQEATLVASVGGLLFAMAFVLPLYAPRVAASLAVFLENPSGWRLENSADLVGLATLCASVGGVLVIPVAVALMVPGVLGTALQGGPGLVPSRVAPDFSRVKISSGLSRLFGPRGWTGFARSLVKLAIVSAAAATGLGVRGEWLMSSMTSDPGLLPATILDRVVLVVVAAFLAMSVLAAADLTWTRYHWRRDHRMSRREIKEELRQSEGDPMLKARLRSLRLARSRKRMLVAVPDATFVIVNPTHYAVALRYRRNEDPAPVVVAKGLDLVALKIRSIAEESGVPVVEDKPLARSLYKSVEVDEHIPVEFYRVMAELIHFLDMRRTRRPDGRGAPGA